MSWEQDSGLEIQDAPRHISLGTRNGGGIDDLSAFQTERYAERLLFTMIFTFTAGASQATLLPVAHRVCAACACPSGVSLRWASMFGRAGDACQSARVFNIQPVRTRADIEAE